MNGNESKQVSTNSVSSVVKAKVSPLGYPTNLLVGEQSFETVNQSIGSVVLQDRQPRPWWIGFTVAFALLMVFFFAVAWLLIRGVGIWGVNIPVAWGFAIVNFVWWIGIAHAGTFISAILLLMFQHWRTAINRFAEAMTLFAIACAGLFPLLHLGRPWVFYWLLPYPDTMGMWPQFRSPLVWDVFAVGTYFTVSLLFWFLGLIPVRKIYRLENLITLRHFNNMANVMLVTGLIVAYGYFIEAFMSWYSGDIFDQYMMTNRAFGPYGWIFWALMFFNVLVPQALWS